MQLEAEATGEPWQRGAQVDDVELVDLAVVVDVLVDGIAAAEDAVLVLRTLIAEHHGLGHAVLVDDDAAFLVAHHGGVGAADAGHFLSTVVAVLVDALVAEAIDAAQGGVQLHARHVRTVLAVELIVQRGQTGLVHRGDLVLVVGKGDVEVGRELAGLDDAVTVEVELPSHVLHVTHILVGQRGVAAAGGNAASAHEQVAGVLPVELHVTGDDVVEESEVSTKVEGLLLLPLQLLQLDVLRVVRAFIQVALALAVLAEVEGLGTGLLAHDAPSRSHGEHGDEGQVLVQPRLLADVPAQRQGGEGTPALVIAELGGAVMAQREVGCVAALVGVVCRVGEIDASPLSAARADVAGDALGSGALYGTAGQAPGTGVLRRRGAAGELSAQQHAQRVVLVAEVRGEGQAVGGGDAQALRRARRHGVAARVVPAAGAQAERHVLVIVAVEDVEHHLALIAQAGVLVVQSQQLVAQLELGGDVIAGLVALGQMGQRHGVLVVQLVAQLLAHGGQHGVVFAGDVVALVVFLVDREVRHAHVGYGQQVTGVAVVLGVGQGDVGLNLDAVADEVVEVHARGEAVQLLLDDGARLVVVAGADAEVGLLTAAAQGQVVVLAPAGLLHQVQPVGVVIVHAPLGEAARAVVNLVNVARSIAHAGVEVLLLQQHGVLVAIEQTVAVGLVGAGQAEAVVHLRLAAHAALGLDLDDAVGTLRSPDGGGGSVLQHRDALNVLRVHVQQLGKLLLVGRGEVEVVGVRLPHVAVDDDEGLAGTVDRRHTTQAHGGAGAQVTRIGHDVKTGNTTLQGLVDGGHRQALELRHRDALLGR